MAKVQKKNETVISKNLPLFCQKVLAIANKEDLSKYSEEELLVFNGAVYGMLSALRGGDRIEFKNSFAHRPKEEVREIKNPRKKLPRASGEPCASCSTKSFKTAADLGAYLNSKALMQKAYKTHGLEFDSSLTLRRLALSLFFSTNGVINIK